jgi:hypothetical protein
MVPRSPGVKMPRVLTGTVAANTMPSKTVGWMSMPSVGVVVRRVRHSSVPPLEQDRATNDERRGRQRRDAGHVGRERDLQALDVRGNDPAAHRGTRVVVVLTREWPTSRWRRRAPGRRFARRGFRARRRGGAGRGDEDDDPDRDAQSPRTLVTRAHADVDGRGIAV